MKLARYKLEIVDRYAGDGSGEIETHARMRQCDRGDYVKFEELNRVSMECKELQQLLNARGGEVDRLRAALKFYADKEHFYLGDDNWDTVSGEPSNILWHAEDPYSVEDGWFARKALENQA